MESQAGNGQPEGMDEEAVFRRQLQEALTLHMPFGKYGPEHFPPEGLLICDLPYEYLSWFARKGCFPGGRLGEVMRLVLQIKQDGAEEVFAVLRGTRERPNLRRVRRTSWHFGEPPEV